MVAPFRSCPESAGFCCGGPAARPRGSCSHRSRRVRDRPRWSRPSGQHRLIPDGVEDAVQNDVVAVIKRVAGHLMISPMFPAPGRSLSLRMTRRGTSSWETQAISGPQAAHSALATVLLPDPELPPGPPAAPVPTPPPHA
jgi:hypothetical protein